VLIASATLVSQCAHGCGANQVIQSPLSGIDCRLEPAIDMRERAGKMVHVGMKHKVYPFQVGATLGIA
jgi:hypothetical protein